MSLTRKFLSAMGIDDDKAEQIINAHLETVNPLKQERDDYKEKSEQLTSVQKELNKANLKLKEFEDSDGKDSWKTKYDDLLKNFNDYKDEIAEKELTAKKQAAYRRLLREVGIADKRIDAILKISDVNELEFDDQNEVKDADSVKKKMKTEWGDFISTTETRGADVANPPAGNNTNTVLSREEIMKIKDTGERQKAWANFLENERKK